MSQYLAITIPFTGTFCTKGGGSWGNIDALDAIGNVWYNGKRVPRGTLCQKEDQR